MNGAGNGSASGDGPPKRRGLLRWLASAAVSAALLAWLLPQIGWDLLAETFANIYLPSVGLYVAISLTGIGARVLRYWLLLERRVGVWPLTLVTTVRNFAVDLLPARAGSLAYVWLITTRAGASFDAGLSSFLLAFVFDIVAIAPILLLALLVVGGATPFDPLALAVVSSVLLAGSIAALYLLAPGLRIGGRITGWVVERTPLDRLPRLDELGERLQGTADQVLDIWRQGLLLPVFGVSLVIRITKFGSLYCLVHAVLASHGYTWESLPFFRVFLGMAAAELSATLPIHGIAGLGTYDVAWTLAFEQLGFPREMAGVSGVATHLITQLQDYTLGILAFLWIMRPGFRSRTSEE